MTIKSRLLKILGMSEPNPHDNYKMLLEGKYQVVETWRGLRLYQKDDERIIYDPHNDKIIRRYRVK